MTANAHTHESHFEMPCRTPNSSILLFTTYVVGTYPMVRLHVTAIYDTVPRTDKQVSKLNSEITLKIEHIAVLSEQSGYNFLSPWYANVITRIYFYLARSRKLSIYMSHVYSTNLSRRSQAIQRNR